MKLAEALVQRADVTARLGQLKQRALRNARHQEGEQTAESPVELLTEYDRLAGALEVLIRRINVTNLATELEPGMTVTDGLARRDVLRLRHRMLVEQHHVLTRRPDEGGSGDPAGQWALPVNEAQSVSGDE